jgi:hypothetical protein
MNQGFSVKSLTQHQDRFIEFLKARGAQVLEPTNEWEVLRFLAGEQTCVIYRTKTGRLTFTGDSYNAFMKFKSGDGSWRAMPRTGHKKKSPPRLQAIRERDGGCCFFCLQPVSIEDESEEHLVAMTHGGPNHIANLFLAHKVCNGKAGHLTAAEKIKMHVDAHLKAVLRNEEKEPA